MRELLAVALAFGLMLILLRKNVNFGVTMLITSATLCVVAGIAPLTVFNVIKTTFTSEKNIPTLLVVFTVSILGGLCGQGQGWMLGQCVCRRQRCGVGRGCAVFCISDLRRRLLRQGGAGGGTQAGP